MPTPKPIWSETEWTKFQELCAVLCSKEEICRIMGVEEKTLEKLIKKQFRQQFDAVYETFCAGGIAGLRKTQFELAQKSAPMAVWLGKQYLGQTDKKEKSEDQSIEFAFEDSEVTSEMTE